MEWVFLVEGLVLAGHGVPRMVADPAAPRRDTEVPFKDTEPPLPTRGEKGVAWVGGTKGPRPTKGEKDVAWVVGGVLRGLHPVLVLVVEGAAEETEVGAAEEAEVWAEVGTRVEEVAGAEGGSRAGTTRLEGARRTMLVQSVVL